MHDETTRLSMGATERALAGAHEARRAAVVGGTPQLVAWVDALARAELEWLAHEASADQAEGSDSERDPGWFGALASVRACLEAGRDVGAEARDLLPLSPSTTFVARGLVLASLASHLEAELAPVAQSLVEALEGRVAEESTVRALLALPVATLVDTPSASTLGTSSLGAALASSLARREAVREAMRGHATPATAWRDAWGLRADSFRISIACTDVPRRHPKAKHLRTQTSHLDLVFGHVPVQGPALDEAWSVRLRPGQGEPLHGVTPARWEGELRATMLDRGEVSGVFREIPESSMRKGKSVVLRGTLESLPKVLRDVEALVGRSFHVADALILAVVGDRSDPALAERVRAWMTAVEL